MTDQTASDADRVLIVGGGIAGLALAGAFSQAGIACEVVERAPVFAPVGAGIVLGVNAMQVMQRFGIAESLAQRGHILSEMAITDARDRVLGRTNLAELEPRFGPNVALHRATLHEILLKLASVAPIRLGLTVERFDARENPIRVRFSDGSEGLYSEIVGADGLRSQTRAQVFGDIPLGYAGYTCWRLVAPRPATLTKAREMWGHGKRFGIVPIDDDRVYCFAVANAPEGQGDAEEGRGVRFRERFAEFTQFGGPVPGILEHLRDDGEAGSDGCGVPLIHNDLCEIVHRPWYRDGVVLVGDAAHGMTPNMGQGAAMALEDVAVLAEMAREARSAGRPIRDIFGAWFERREPRVRWVQDQSRRIGRVGHWEGRLVCALRNRALSLVPDRASSAALVRMAEQEI